MRASWEALHAGLDRSVRTLQAEQSFQQAKAQHPVLAGFDDAEKVVDHLVNARGDGEAKDRLLATLVAMVQQREHHEVASGLLWLGLWPGLTGVYGRRVRHFHGEPDELVAEIARAFTELVERLDLTAVHRVAATLVRSTERDVMYRRKRQVIMFTHQSGSIWADMANIVWASGLHVTAAWYVVTETDSALREGSYVKGTVLLVLRKRGASERTTRDDLAWELKEEVEEQVATLTGLNQRVSPRYRDENLFADADLQMAGYAAALRVLTRYAVIDGKEMSAEAIRPRVRGEKTFVDELIEFAVGVANEALAPRGIEKSHWDKLRPAERFYCKLLELEAQGHKTLDNYQNFAKAFKVRDFKPFLASHKANAARLKGATEFGRAEMSDGSELASTPLRATLYALMELQKGVDGGDVLTHMSHNVDGFFDANIRAILVELAEYLANKLAQLRPEEASAARVLRELLKNQRM